VLLALLLATAAASAQPGALVRGGVRVEYWAGDEALARRALGVATAPHGFAGLPPGPALTRGTIVLAPDQAVWDSVTGGRAPHWSAGVAIPSRQLIVLPPRAAGTHPLTALRHELAHLALHDYLPEPVPRWFSEGYATWASGEWDATSGWQIRLAFVLRRAPSLDSLALGWPAGADRARLAYLLSASAVRYMAERGGERGFAGLLEAWRRTGSLDLAMRSVYGMTLGQFEAEWVKVVERRYGWLLMLSQVGVFWGLVALLLVALFGHRIREKRRRIHELEAEYHMLPAASHGVEYPIAEPDDGTDTDPHAADGAPRRSPWA
jgi:hypothetical protein